MNDRPTCRFCSLPLGDDGGDDIDWHADCVVVRDRDRQRRSPAHPAYGARPAPTSMAG